MRRLLGIFMLCLTLPMAARAEQHPSADQLIRRMSTTLASLGSFHFTATFGFDDVPLPDVKVKYRGTAEVYLLRPDRLRVEYRDELTSREVWVDGQTVTVLSPRENHWAAVPAAASLDATLKQLAAERGVSFPLDDFLLSDPYSSLMARAEAHRYVGTSEIDGVPCHHLIVGQEDVNWQIWIEAGDRALPRQLVITYRSLPMAPEFIAVFKGWELDPKLPDSKFQPAIPADATEIEFVQLERARP